MLASSGTLNTERVGQYLRLRICSSRRTLPVCFLLPHLALFITAQ